MNLDVFKFLAPKPWPDVVEILLVAFVVYRFLLFLVGTRAIQILVGLVFLSIGYFLALFARFTMISTLLGLLFTYGAFVAVVVVQPQLRHPLARLGQSGFLRALPQGDRPSAPEEIARGRGRLSPAG